MYIRNTFSIYRRVTSFVAPRRAARLLIATIQKSRHVQMAILLTRSFCHNGLLRITLRMYWEKCLDMSLGIFFYVTQYWVIFYLVGSQMKGTEK